MVIKRWTLDSNPGTITKTKAFSIISSLPEAERFPEFLGALPISSLILLYSVFLDSAQYEEECTENGDGLLGGKSHFSVAYRD
jgi:hypothetical protein